MELPTLPRYELGFDYSKALLEIRKHMTYEEIANYLRYQSPASVHRVMKGVMPPHWQGEAIWALYVHLFGKKPPLNIPPEESAIANHHVSSA